MGFCAPMAPIFREPMGFCASMGGKPMGLYGVFTATAMLKVTVLFYCLSNLQKYPGTLISPNLNSWTFTA